MNSSKSKSKRVRVIYIILGMIFLFSIIINVYFGIRLSKISSESVKVAQRLQGLDFNRAERKMMIDNLKENLKSYNKLREISMDNSTSPAVSFNPILPGIKLPTKKAKFSPSNPKNVKVPKNFEGLAFYTVNDLAQLIRTRKITSTQLTKMYIKRLKIYGPKLKCLITLMEDSALKEAASADIEIAKGKYRGYLHGIPFGVKDLLAAKGFKTTWGAAPYKDQMIDQDATVVKRLRDAGAVLVAKLSMGALAMGDVWFDGRTKNPWNPKEGSSGSSAGPASATAAGLVGFAIGTETWGSIVSPSTRCRVTGLRPTFGRVSRFGAMALSWTMDKIGPICRSVEDCALVFNAIYGPDGKDVTVINYPFSWDASKDFKKLRIGYYKSAFESDTVHAEEYKKVLDVFRKIGVELIPFKMPEFPVYSLSFILDAEASTAFDVLTRSNRDDLMVKQSKDSWPNIFRQAQFIPAVEYIQANRARVLLMQKMHDAMGNIDVIVTPSFGGSILLTTNLTGHPAVVVPIGADKKGRSLSISFIGRLYDEGNILLAAKAFQDATDFHLKHPDLSALLKEGADN